MKNQKGNQILLLLTLSINLYIDIITSMKNVVEYVLELKAHAPCKLPQNNGEQVWESIDPLQGSLEHKVDG
mgnify:CR=1 FL=1